MVRSFAPRPLPPAVVDRLLAAALRAPTAGNTKGTAWVVLEGAEETRRYWDAVTTAGWRHASSRWPGLARAPVIAVSLVSPPAYVARYREADKAEAGPEAPPSSRNNALGTGESAWPVPYWWGDAAFGVMSVLLGAVDEGLGACFLGNFRGETALLSALGVPEGWRVFGTVALGYPDGDDHRSPSLDRHGPPASARLHRGRWGGEATADT